ncbi:hypothetical protein F5Y06DRAFT_302675 [Hypoxylon sp. FL0890]|nr:hypothetical protein F5Y06DRAFT_302675 [Hypoxylon sp. FL0890]
MPLLYGEGDKAFFRLQEEICKQTTDMSLFAWKAMPATSPEEPGQKFRGLFANHPREFSGDDYSYVITISSESDFGEFAITNRGIRFDEMRLWVSPEHGILMHVGWNCQDRLAAQSICLTRVAGGFVRCRPSVITQAEPRYQPFDSPRFYIRQHLSLADMLRIEKQQFLPVKIKGPFESFTAWPLDLWDPHRTGFAVDHSWHDFVIDIKVKEDTDINFESFLVVFTYRTYLVFSRRDPEYGALVGLVQQRRPLSSSTPRPSDEIYERRHRYIPETAWGQVATCSGEHFTVSVIRDSPWDGPIEISINRRGQNLSHCGS